MNLVLLRTHYLPECVKGNLYAEGRLVCFTLEPPLTFDGQQNAPFKTCIPEGVYTVVRKMSLHFEMVVPALANVPGRTAIEIHPLNRPDQTNGCIGVGLQWIHAPEVGMSDLAFADLMSVLRPAWAANEVVTLEIRTPEGVSLA
jgi:hypothetical protein